MMVLLMGLVVDGWIACIVALEFCFDAVGDPVGSGVLSTGFAAGVAVDLLSMIPVGLGVRAASIAGGYTLLGASFKHALLATILSGSSITCCLFSLTCSFTPGS